MCNTTAISSGIHDDQTHIYGRHTHMLFLLTHTFPKIPNAIKPYTTSKASTFKITSDCCIHLSTDSEYRISR